MILANPGMGPALGLPPHIQEAAAAGGAVRLCVPASWSHSLFATSAGGLDCAVAAGPAVVPTHTGF